MVNGVAITFQLFVCFCLYFFSYQEVVDRLKCFQKYSPKVKQELARVLFYERYKDGRVIIQQGHIGQSFYFIISGKVTVRITEVDKATGTQNK